MHRPASFTTPICFLALISFLWLSSLAPALAATVTDTFPLKLTGKEWCRNDPKFFDTTKVKVSDDVTLTLTRDVLNTNDLTDIQAKINNSGNATIDAITLNGRALKANKSGSIAQLALSGRDPGNPDHFFTLRGTATFDKAGKLTKVTGTYVYQILSESGGVQDVDCFGSGTFGTQKLPSSGSGHGENLLFGFDIDRVTGKVTRLGFVNFNSFDGPGTTVWNCFDPCAGASMNLTARTLTLVNTVLTATLSPIPAPPITLNGTLGVGGGTLTVANAPDSVGGTFVPVLRYWTIFPGGTAGAAQWDEGKHF